MMIPHLSPCEQNVVSLVRARELNQHAAFCIEIGCYTSAIESLIEALEVAESTNLDSSLACGCGACSLDACVQYSYTYANVFHRGVGSPSSGKDKRCKELQKASAAAEDGGGFIYRQPIRIPPGLAERGHIIGMTLPLILTFNLAMAYQLNSVCGRHPTVNNRRQLQKILQLYELAYRWHSEKKNKPMQEREGTTDDAMSMSSVLFSMAIANNLAQIHLAVNNTTKYNLCLQHLLSTMMFLVDCQQLKAMNNHSYAEHNSDQQRPSIIELDGFLQNTICLFLRTPAAAAA